MKDPSEEDRHAGTLTPPGSAVATSAVALSEDSRQGRVPSEVTFASPKAIVDIDESVTAAPTDLPDLLQPPSIMKDPSEEDRHAGTLTPPGSAVATSAVALSEDSRQGRVPSEVTFASPKAIANVNGKGSDESFTTATEEDLPGLLQPPSIMKDPSEEDRHAGTLTPPGSAVAASAVASSEDSRQGRGGVATRNTRNAPKKYGVSNQEESKQTIVSQSDRWDKNIRALRDFKKERGHCNVSETHPDKSLVHFVQRIRRQSPGLLAPGRMKDLLELGFVFNVHEAQWQSKYAEVVKTKESGGMQACMRNAALSRWIGKQREAYAKLILGKKSSMTDKRISLLEELGIGLSPYGGATTVRAQCVCQTTFVSSFPQSHACYALVHLACLYFLNFVFSSFFPLFCNL